MNRRLEKRNKHHIGESGPIVKAKLNIEFEKQELVENIFNYMLELGPQPTDPGDSEDRSNVYTKQNQFSQSIAGFSGDTSNVSSDSRSVILKNLCGFLYSVPRSIRSLHIEIFQI